MALSPMDVTQFAAVDTARAARMLGERPLRETLGRPCPGGTARAW
ncbi:hypothetical protein SVIOM342S_02047 [Streptomyces violaceorubidus]